MQNDGFTQNDGFKHHGGPTQEVGSMQNDGLTQKDGLMQNDGPAQKDVFTQKVAWVDVSDDELVWQRRPPETPTRRKFCGEDSVTTPMASTRRDKVTCGQLRRQGRLN